MTPLDWVLVVLTGIGGVFGLCCLFDGARRIVLYGPSAASNYLIGVGAAICLTLAAYAYWKSGQVEAHFVEFVMWLVWGGASLVFGALFAREPVRQRSEEHTKIEPVLAPPVAARAPQPAGAAASAKPAPAPAKPADAPPPAATPKPAVGEDTVPLPKPAVGLDTVPLPKPGIPPAPAKPADASPPAASRKPAVGEDTVPLPKPAVGEDTVPLPKPGIPSALARSSVGEDTVPMAKPAPGTFRPPPKKGP
jgi:hypothetical protein